MYTPKGRVDVRQHKRWLSLDEMNLPLAQKNEIVRQRLRDFGIDLPRKTIFAAENVEEEIL